MSTEWTMAVRCKDCGEGVPLLRVCLVPKGTPLREEERLLCRVCGCPTFASPRPGREVDTGVWYKPWTWGCTAWEWRDQDEKPWPGDREAK